MYKYKLVILNHKSKHKIKTQISIKPTQNLDYIKFNIAIQSRIVIKYYRFYEINY
jgi:hypothetical protein